MGKTTIFSAFWFLFYFSLLNFAMGRLSSYDFHIHHKCFPHGSVKTQIKHLLGSLMLSPPSSQLLGKTRSSCGERAAAAKDATPSATHTHGGDSPAKDCTLLPVTALGMWVRVSSWVTHPHLLGTTKWRRPLRTGPHGPFHPLPVPRLRGSPAARALT